MQMIYKARIYDILVDISNNKITASYLDPQKVKHFNSKESGIPVKSIAYADIFSVSIPISENYTKGEDLSRLFETADISFMAMFQKLCAKIDEKMN